MDTDTIISLILNTGTAICLVFIAYKIIRPFIDPDYRSRLEEKAKQKKEARLRRQRALNSMTTTERLLYEQNKELRRFHWYITLRDLFAPRHRR